MEFGSRTRTLARTATVGSITIVLAAACSSGTEVGGRSERPGTGPGGKPKHAATCFETLKYGGNHIDLSAYGTNLQAAVDAGMATGTFNATAFDMRWKACTSADLGGIEEIMKRMAGGKDIRRRENTVGCAILLANLGVIRDEGVLSDARFKSIQDKYDGGKGRPGCDAVVEESRAGGFHHHDAILTIPFPVAGQDTFTPDQTQFAAYEGGATTAYADGASYVPVPEWARQFRPEYSLGTLAAAAA